MKSAGWFCTVCSTCSATTTSGTRETMALLAVAVAPIGLYLILLWRRELDAESKRKKRIRTLRQF